MHPATRTRSRLRSLAGFTIVEVAMASFVMAFGIATSIITIQSGFKQIDLGRGTTIASQIIQSEMERIRMMNFTTVFAMASAAGSPSGQPTGTSVFDGSTYFSSAADVVGRYSVTRTVTADSTRPTEAVNISVSVTWRTYDNRSHRRTFSSVYVKNGLYDYYYTIAHP